MLEPTFTKLRSLVKTKQPFNPMKRPLQATILHQRRHFSPRPSPSTMEFFEQILIHLDKKND